VVDAVRAAIDVQRAMAIRNADFMPGKRPMPDTRRSLNGSGVARLEHLRVHVGAYSPQGDHLLVVG
jgi:hypothetical protein